MSYILEALRKVEQQREHLPAHGLSSRRRYYSAMDGRALPRAWLLAIAAVVGASLSGGVAAYLVADNRKEAAPPPQPQLQAQRPSEARSSPAQPPASATPPVMAQPAQAKAPTTSPALPPRVPAQAGVRTPGPRQSQAKPSPQPQQKRTIAQEHPPRESKPVETPATTPKPEAPSEPKQPVPPTRQQETELASARPASSGVSAAPLPPKAALPVTPATEDPLDMIAPPKAVEVQPFRPNDVIRPPAARKRAASGSEPPLLSTLSSQFQSMVPKMTINAQVYSSAPRQRFVVINMKRYNEGQSTAEGVSIEAIRQQDIILTYQGQRFRLGR